jgi:hypothetical protein
MGLVCFRLKGPNVLSQNLLYLLNDSGRIHMVPAVINGKYAIRFCVNCKNASDSDILSSWDMIKSGFRKHSIENSNISATKLKRLRYGISKMISDPRMYKVFNIIINNDLNNNSTDDPENSHQLAIKSTSFDVGKYLAHSCSVIESFDEEESEI